MSDHNQNLVPLAPSSTLFTDANGNLTTAGSVPVPGLTSVLTSSDNAGGLSIQNLQFIKDSSNLIAIDVLSRHLRVDNGNISLDWEGGSLLAPADGSASLDWGNRFLTDTPGNPALYWDTRLLIDTNNGNSIDWGNRLLQNHAFDTVMDWSGTAMALPQITTPANPASGFDVLYFKSDDKLYGKSSAGVEVLIGPSGGGGTPTLAQVLTAGSNGGGTAASNMPLVGVTDGSNAAAGNVGEYVNSFVSGVTFAATGTYKDATSIVLTAGDWDVSINGFYGGGGGTVTAVEGAISTTPGNSATGLIVGDNYIGIGTTGSNVSSEGQAVAIPSYRMSLTAGSTTVYLKILSNYVTTSPNFSGRITARRVR